MRPWQILVFFLTVCLSLLLISLVFPSDGVQISNDISLKFFNPLQFNKPDSVQYADISQIIENSGIKDDVQDEPDSLWLEDSDPEIIIQDTVRVDSDSLRNITHRIEFSKAGRKSFNEFFSRLNQVKDNKELLRILHYGDSQIETDRMTGYIRNKLQKKFGGSGCGLVPPVPLYNGKMSIKQDHSNNWERITGYGNKDTLLSHNSYGALISYAKYYPEKLGRNEIPWIEIQPSPIAYTTAKRYNQISAYLSKKNSDFLAIEILVNDTLFDRIEVKDELNYNKISWNFTSTPADFVMKFYGKGSPEFYGISMDNNWGVAMDNIPLRGSAGLVFSKNDTIQLRQMYDDLNVGLIILQFGGNVVPYMTNAKRFENFLKRELTVLRSLCPGAAVLVIGPSDMSIKENGHYTTYPSLEKVRDAMKKASLESGYAFWDMYEAMGGKNSMPAWAFAEPSLAVSDFVHFNTRGAKLIAEMMYNAIIYEYNIWEKNGKK